MSFIVNIAKELTNINFNVAPGLCDSQNISNYSKFITFARQEGHICYIVCVVNCDMLPDYKDFAEKMQNHIASINGNKVVVNIFVSSNVDDELMSFAQNDIDDYNADIVNIKWVVDIKNETIIVKGSQPDDILDIRQVVLSSFENSAESSISTQQLKSQAREAEVSSVLCKIPLATYALMLINFVFWMIMYTNTGEKLIADMWLDKSLVANGQYYRLFTYMFTHGGISHFMCNTFTIFIIGSRLEKYIGHNKFLFIYIVSGIIAGIVSLFALPNGVSVGASGAIFGIIGGLLCLIKNKKHSIGGFDYSVAVLYAIIGVGSGFMIPNVDNFAHIGGLIAGLFVSVLLKIGKNK